MYSMVHDDYCVDAWDYRITCINYVFLLKKGLTAPVPRVQGLARAGLQCRQTVNQLTNTR
jgi:hypothetical protein